MSMESNRTEDLTSDGEDEERTRRRLDAIGRARLAVSSRNVSLSTEISKEEPGAWLFESVRRLKEGDMEAIRFMKENDLIDAENWDLLLVRALSSNLPKERTVELCRMACQAGVHLRTMSEDERKPLAYACSTSKRDHSLHHAVQVFLDQPFCPVDVMDAFRRTALHYACLSSDPDPLVISLLLEHGADPCAQDGGGYTPLHHLASRAILDGCELLLSRRTECLLLPTRSGRLPLDCLLQSMLLDRFQDCRVRSEDTLQLFLERGGESMRDLFLSGKDDSWITRPRMTCLESCESVMSILFAYGYVSEGCDGSKEPTEMWKRMESIHGWTISKHRRYPSRFRDAIRALFLSRKRHEKVGGPLGRLDRFVFLHIVRHVSRLDWIRLRHRRFDVGPRPSE